MKNGSCPQCQHEIAFGIQRCTNCGVFIYWNGDKSKPKFPVLRTTPLALPQKAIIYSNVFGRALQDDSSPVVREYFPKELVVIVDMVGDFVAPETGGWLPYQSVGLFGRLQTMTVVDPTTQTPLINVLDRPIWGQTDSERGNIIFTVRPGDRIEVWETRPDWIRIAAGTGWISSYWFDPKSIRKLR